MTTCILTGGPHDKRVLHFAHEPYEINAIPNDNGSRFVGDPVNLIGPPRHVYLRNKVEHTVQYGVTTTYHYSGALGL